MRIKIFIFIVILLFYVMARPGSASPQRDLAFIILTSRYANAPERMDVLNAGLKMALSFQASGYEIKLLLNPDSSLVYKTTQSIALASRVKPLHQVVIYLAGASYIEQELVRKHSNIYFAAHDSVLPWNEFPRTAQTFDLQISELQKIILKIKTTNLLLMFDSTCNTSESAARKALAELLLSNKHTIHHITILHAGTVNNNDFASQSVLFQYFSNKSFANELDIDQNGHISSTEWTEQVQNTALEAKGYKSKPFYAELTSPSELTNSLFDAVKPNTLSTSNNKSDFNSVMKNSSIAELWHYLISTIMKPSNDPVYYEAFNHLFFDTIPYAWWKQIEDKESDQFQDLQKILEIHSDIILAHDDVNNMSKLFSISPGLKNGRTLFLALQYGATQIGHILMAEKIRPSPVTGIEDLPMPSRDLVLYFSPASIRAACGWNSLWEAIYRGDFNQVKKLLPRKKEDLKDAWGRTPLHVAATHGYLEIFSYLLNLGYNATEEDGDRNTPVDMAISTGRANIVRLMIQKGIRLTSEEKVPEWTAAQNDRLNVLRILGEHDSERWWNMLEPALIWGRTDVLKLVLEHMDVTIQEDSLYYFLALSALRGPAHSFALFYDFLNAHDYLKIENRDADEKEWLQNIYQLTAVGAVSQGNISLLQKIQAHINLQGIYGSNKMTLLHIAASNGQQDVAEFLINQGLNLCQKDARGRLPVSLAIRSGYKAMPHWLFKLTLKKCGAEALASPVFLETAAQGGSSEMVQWALEHGTSPDSRSPAGWSALHWATLFGHIDVVHVLLEHGANPNMRDFRGRTPLIIAAIYGHESIIDLLAVYGADAALKDYDQQTFLHAASMSGLQKWVQWALGKKIEVNAIAAYNETPLHKAAIFGHLDIVQQLIFAGAHINATNQDGDTPLQHAIEEGHLELAQWLLQHNANPKIQDSYGWDALKMAQEAQRDSFENLLASFAHVRHDYKVSFFRKNLVLKLYGLVASLLTILLLIIIYRLIIKIKWETHIANQLIGTDLQVLKWFVLALIIIVGAFVFHKNATLLRSQLIKKATYYSFIDSKGSKIKSSYFVSESWLGRRWIAKRGQYSKTIIDENTKLMMRNYNFRDIRTLQLKIIILPNLYHPEGFAYRPLPVVEVFASTQLFDYTTVMHEVAHWYDFHALSPWEETLYELKMHDFDFNGQWLQHYRQMNKFTRFYSTWRKLEGTATNQMYANLFEYEQMEDLGLVDLYPLRQSEFYRPIFANHGGKPIEN